MKTIPLTPDTEALARRLVWFEPPAEALSDTSRFVAYALVRATHEDMTLLRKFLSDDDLREALDHAPPGIIDPRSWAYWNSRLGAIPLRRCPSVICVEGVASVLKRLHANSHAVPNSPENKLVKVAWWKKRAIDPGATARLLWISTSRIE